MSWPYSRDAPVSSSVTGYARWRRRACGYLREAALRGLIAVAGVDGVGRATVGPGGRRRLAGRLRPTAVVMAVAARKANARTKVALRLRGWRARVRLATGSATAGIAGRLDLVRRATGSSSSSSIGKGGAVVTLGDGGGGEGAATLGDGGGGEGAATLGDGGGGEGAGATLGDGAGLGRRTVRGAVGCCAVGAGGRDHRRKASRSFSIASSCALWTASGVSCSAEVSCWMLCWRRSAGVTSGWVR